MIRNASKALPLGEFSARINGPGGILALVEQGLELDHPSPRLQRAWAEVRTVLSRALPAVNELRAAIWAPAAVYSDPEPREFEIGEIAHLLTWIENEGTMEGVWLDAQTDGSVEGSIALDRALWLEAAAFLDRGRMAGTLVETDEYNPVEAAGDIAGQLREFDIEHGTRRGPIPADDRRFRGYDGDFDYAVQEWRAAHPDA